jgi:acylphosphatase
MRIVEIHAIFSGRVQGVGFRAVVQRCALSLGVKGIVCNLPDGSVELYAQGSKETLEQLIANIKSEMSKNVREVKLNYYETDSKFDNFKII